VQKGGDIVCLGGTSTAYTTAKVVDGDDLSLLTPTGTPPITGGPRERVAGFAPLAALFAATVG
jgi:hypothetical protein